MTGEYAGEMERTDRILEAIDVGLQETEDLAPVAHDDGCCRCGAEELAPGSSGFCVDCRAYMLGDTPIDPLVAIQADEFVATRAAIRAEVEAAGDPLFVRLLDHVEDLETSFADRLAAGEISILHESGDLVTGPEAIAMIRAREGLQ